MIFYPGWYLDLLNLGMRLVGLICIYNNALQYLVLLKIWIQSMALFCPGEYIYIYLAEFFKTYLKTGQNIRTESWR